MALRAALAGMAGLALGRASTSHGVQRLVVTALAVAAVPLAGRVLGSLLGGAAYSRLAPPPRHFADRQARRRQLRRAAQQAAEQAAAVGAISEEEQRLLAMVTAQAGSRTERVRMIAGVLETLRQIEAGPGPHSRSTQLVSALVVYELNSLVDEMDYEELHAAFGGHPLAKGLADDAIAALPAVQLTSEAILGLHSSTCAVCLDAFGEGDTARVLPACSHCFHAACVDTWLASKAVCPVCRAQVEAPAAKGERSSSSAGEPSAAAL